MPSKHIYVRYPGGGTVSDRVPAKPGGNDTRNFRIILDISDSLTAFKRWANHLHMHCLITREGEDRLAAIPYIKETKYISYPFRYYLQPLYKTYLWNFLVVQKRLSTAKCITT